MTDLTLYTCRYAAWDDDGNMIGSGTVTGKTAARAEALAEIRAESLTEHLPEDACQTWVEIPFQVCESDGSPCEPRGRVQ